MTDEAGGRTPALLPSREAMHTRVVWTTVQLPPEARPLSDMGSCFANVSFVAALVFLCRLSISLVVLGFSLLLQFHGHILRELPKCGIRDGGTEEVRV